MNYIAHAHLAAAHRNDPWFTLGAMLPDWQGWIGDRIREVHHPGIADGVRFHHATDAAFHAGARFVALVCWASEALRDSGLARGPARGAAHVGIEFLLDGALVADAGACRAYCNALEVAADASHHLDWNRPESGGRFERVAARLARNGPPRDFEDPHHVAVAIARTLERRPRLRVPPDQLEQVAVWAGEARREVLRDAATLLAETERALSAQREVA
jgi:acyl carrier protein phosphodiesterase